MTILKNFGIKKPNRLSVEVDAAVKEWQLKHAEAVECLVCSAIARGADPMKLELVREQRGQELVIWIRERKSSEDFGPIKKVFEQINKNKPGDE